MHSIDIQHIETLEDYLFYLGVSSVSLKTIHNLQRKALDCNFLETDEREQVETIKYEIGRSIIAISNLLSLMEERGLVDIDKVTERIQSQATKETHL